jgi:hypothetical protein
MHPAESRQAIEGTQLRKMAQEFDVLGKGHRQLLMGRLFLQHHPNQIVAALQNKKAVHCPSPELNFRYRL